MADDRILCDILWHPEYEVLEDQRRHDSFFLNPLELKLMLERTDSNIVT